MSALNSLMRFVGLDSPRSPEHAPVNFIENDPLAIARERQSWLHHAVQEAIDAAIIDKSSREKREQRGAMWAAKTNVINYAADVELSDAAAAEAETTQLLSGVNPIDVLPGPNPGMESSRGYLDAITAQNNEDQADSKEAKSKDPLAELIKAAEALATTSIEDAQDEQFTLTA